MNKGTVLDDVFQLIDGAVFQLDLDQAMRGRRGDFGPEAALPALISAEMGTNAPEVAKASADLIL